MTLAEYIRSRRIRRLVHFSPRRNLIGMFQLGGIWPREKLVEYAKSHANEDLLAYVTWNDSVRLDSRQDCVNLSIERINSFLFPRFKQRFEDRFNDEEPWCVIEIDPDVLLTPGTVFTKANAASRQVKRFGTAPGLEGLQALFKDRIVTQTMFSTHVDVRTKTLPSGCPTSVQAEAMVPGIIPLEKLKGLVFEAEQDLLEIKCMLEIQFPEVNLPPMRVSPEEFMGPPKGM